MKKWLLTLPALLSFIPFADAHCPLCTAGIAAAAGGAAILGVDSSVIGVLTGGFAIATGLWVAKMIKKKYVPMQTSLLVILSFAATVLPLIYIMDGFYPLYISWFGEYGSIFNRTYLVNTFFAGSVLGSLAVFAAPSISKGLVKLRNGKMIKFQGVMLTVTLLAVAGAMMQVVI